MPEETTLSHQLRDVQGARKVRNADGSFNLVINPSPPSPPTVNPPAMYPFRLYQAPNMANAADNWRTFQMRLGYIGFRSKYFPPGGGNSVGVIADGGNLENVIQSITGSDAQSYFENTTI